MDYRKIFEENLETIIKLLSIPSVYDEGSVSEDMPYGKNVHEAFEFMRELSLKDGFEVKSYGNRALSISYGKGDRRIDIASHLDVVAADPEDFDIHIENGRLYGRGTQDMKVAMFLTYLSLKLLREKYPAIDKEMRIVLGTDEERTMDDMKHYISVAGYPDFAFTPDGCFPMTIAEKGAIMWRMKGNYSGIIESLDGGKQCNVVSPYAEVILKDDDIDRVARYINENGLSGSVELIDGKLKVAMMGKAAHASVPFKGHNATIDLLRLIADIYGDGLCAEISAALGDCYGRGFDAFVGEENYLSVNLGILKIEDGKVYSEVDCRYPSGTTSAQLTEKLKKAIGLDISLDYDDEPTSCTEDDPYVQILLKTYRDVTGDQTRPIVSGGVSYSKVFKHCVGYGMSMPEGESTAHQKGENISLDECLVAFRIYYEAMEKLILM